MSKRTRAPRPSRLKKTVHVIQPHIDIPKRTVFSADDENLPREKLTSIEVDTTLPVDTLPLEFDVSTNVSVDRILALWQKHANTLAPQIEDCLARSFAITEVLAVAEKELRESRVDPNANIMGSITDELQAIMNQRILLLLTTFMFDDDKEAVRMTEKLLENLTISKPKSAIDFLRRTFGKSEIEQNPYGEPTKLGVTQSYE